MPGAGTAVAVFEDHITAENALRKLTQAGFDLCSPSAPMRQVG